MQGCERLGQRAMPTAEIVHSRRSRQMPLRLLLTPSKFLDTPSLLLFVLAWQALPLILTPKRLASARLHAFPQHLALLVDLKQQRRHCAVFLELQRNGLVPCRHVFAPGASELVAYDIQIRVCRYNFHLRKRIFEATELPRNPRAHFFWGRLRNRRKCLPIAPHFPEGMHR